MAASSSWMGHGATASLLGNDVAVYGGGESLWVLPLATLQWVEIWTTGDTPPHGLRFHTATPLRLPIHGADAGGGGRSASQDSTSSSSSSYSALVVTGGEPRASADLVECEALGPSMCLHALNVRQRSWTLLPCTGDVPLNRCFHTTTKLRGTTLAVYGGRPLGHANGDDENAAPIWDDSEATMARLTAEGFYDVYLVDAAVGAWRRLQVQTSAADSFYPCLWGHAAFATSVFPPRRSQSGEFRNRIDLVVHGGFDLSQDNLEDALRRSASKAYVLQPVSESQPTLLKWGLAPLGTPPGSGSGGADGGGNFVPECALHTAASTDTSKDAAGGGGAHPAFLLGGFMQGVAEDGALIPSSSCGRIAVRGTWAEGPRGQVVALPPLAALTAAEQLRAGNNLYCRPLLLYYSDQLLVIESTERFWLLDLQEQPGAGMEWAPVDTALGPNEDVERWRIGCPVHAEFAANNPADPEEIEIPANIPGSSPPNMRALQQQSAQQQQPESGKRETLTDRRNRRQAERSGDVSSGAEDGGSGGGRVLKTRVVRKRKEPKMPDPPQPGDARGVWKCLKDDKTGRLYFVNKETRKSTWKVEETVFVEPVEDPDDAYEEVVEEYWSDGDGAGAGTPSAGAWANATRAEPRPGEAPTAAGAAASGGVGGNNNNMHHFLGAAAGGPDGTNSATSNWWNAAADAKVRNREDSQQRAHNMSHGHPSRGDSVVELQPPSRTQSSVIPPPSGTPSDIHALMTQHRRDLPIDFLLGGIDHDEEDARRAEQQQQAALAEQLLRKKQRPEDKADMDALFQLPASLAADTAAAAVVDPAETLDYPFDIETALLLPLSVVLRARELWREKRDVEYESQKAKQLADVKSKTTAFDARKFLRNNTHWESASECERKEEHRRQMSAARGMSPERGFTADGKRSVLDVLPSMLQKMRPAALTEAGLAAFNSGGGAAAHRPPLFVAADWSRAASTDGDGVSTRGSTPVDGRVFHDVLESRSGSAVSATVSATGLRAHHVSAVVRDMFCDDKECF